MAKSIYEMSESELRKLANRKNNKGCATRDALKAQKELRERTNSMASLSDFTHDRNGQMIVPAIEY